ncbi:RING finger protein 10 [Lingula anatina]|uniref:E3 ubiquitin-protein ligase RNF10 n=1 Tax=Lingula anatina TaxID=7574 RepID=A0A1S3IYG7_LINAN|nr:RING finger protein 10 [Lingula anatina]|eukprot:XP_013402589.1 RING finger protein 10 [Lingula anatina]
MQESVEETEDMDRKTNNRASSVPPKGNGSDSGNRKSDNGRQTRKRDNGNNRPKQEPGFQRKQPVPQKSKAFSDKRPQSRGNKHNRQRDEVAKEDRAGPELGSALRPFGKKTNLNHLLNFTFAPREQDYSARTRTNAGRRKVRYNKEQFLQANCQFIVSTDGDYTLNAVDPDSLVGWEHIEQVRIFSFEVPSCPICLYPPVAAKITRCGHIYCWTCMLHYLSLTDKTWNKCPICYEAVHKEDLKSVSAMSVHQYSPGDQITMRLMKKERGTTFAMPKSQWEPREGRPYRVDDKVDTHFAKLLLASGSFVKDLINEEKLALEEKMGQETDTLEESFIEGALEILKSKQGVKTEVEAVTTRLQLSDLTVEDKEEEVVPIVKVVSENVVEYVSAFDDVEEEKKPIEAAATAMDTNTSDSSEMNGSSQHMEHMEEDKSADHSASIGEVRVDSGQPMVDSCLVENPVDQELTVEEAAEELALPPAPKQSAQKFFYFYQASDGQNIYMNSLNIQMLVQEYGSLENCPETITASIVDMEGIFMTEELRKRLRYLSHMPLTCEFSVAELALKSPIVSKETIKKFAGQIDHRRRMRQRKAREEHKRAKKIQAEENKKYGIYPELRVPLESRSQFPEYSNSEALTDSPGLRSSSPLTTASTSSSANTPFGSPLSTLKPLAAEFQPGSPISDDGQSSTPSFAQMLKAGKAKPSPVAAWPVQTSSTPSRPPGHSPGSDENSDSEDRVPVPVFQTSFGDAIQAALDKLDSPGTVEVAVNNGIPKEAPTTGKKKKKGKTLLFSTSMARSK